MHWRLERWLVEDRSWSLADLRVRYLDHPLAARFARRVIYTTGTTDVIFVDGFPIDVAGTTQPLDDSTALSLWHPLGRASAGLQAWRELLSSLGIVQPFKQIDREIYTLTDAERAAGIYSDRYAGRLIRQHQFAALCRERGWSYRLQGQFDGGNVPTKRLATYDLEVELEVDLIDDSPIAASGIYLHVAIGRLQLARNRAPISLANVPARCFSEIMRDVDLFATTCSAGA